MGGAGVASSTGLTAVYYNPAGLLSGSSTGLRLSLAPSYSDYQKVADAFSRATDISTFLTDNFSSELAAKGNLNALFGLKYNKIGLSVMALPLGNYAADTLASDQTIFIEKGAFALQAKAAYSIRYDYVLTLGRTFSLPILPANVDAGVNLKSINALYGTFAPAALATSAPYTTGTGNGTAFDLGLRTNLEVPILGSAAVGVTMRDLAGQINYTRKQKTYYLNNLTGTVTTSADSDLVDKAVTLDSVTVIGITGQLGTINLGLAADLELDKAGTITHLGLEYPLLSGLILARAGVISGPTTSKTTYGAKFNLPIFSLGAAGIIDNNDKSATAWTFDIGLGD